MKYIINHIYSFIILTLIGIFFCPAEFLAQTDKTATVRGVIYDGEEAGEPLIGSNVILNNGDGAATDFNGAYSFNAKPGSYTITVKYIGYQTQTKNIRLSAGETKEFSLTLMPESNQLDDVVISASKYEQKLGDVPVSMAVIKPALIENKATRDAQAIVEQVPGVQINENQVSIRGGSGWSYGAGSRVLVMVDGMPMLAGDANDVKWSAIPLENISQIEILKGASSVLYGSSALNGVINIRTQYPKDKPVTKVNISNGFYNNGYASRMGTSLISGDSVLDQRSDQTWWDSPRGYIQGNFTHLRKLSENDELVLGGFFMKDQGYRFGENDQRARINGGWKHFSKKINGLSYGLNLNNNFNNSTIFFLWAGADSVLHALG
ncbi:MAG: TonB-dependent receptor plug domain-containing protein, partial [Bacteroidota bacterium]|nr:TonB-dependent receptor plug domain-containing protein [Bacteroidota bacterium]